MSELDYDIPGGVACPDAPSDRAAPARSRTSFPGR